MPTRPMLAMKVTDLSQVRLPCYATPKIDGIRCLKLNDRALTRTFKDVPNHFIRGALSNTSEGCDGELITLTDGQRDDFNTIQSKVMSFDGTPDFQFWIFDWVLNGLEAVPFMNRWDHRPTCGPGYENQLNHELITNLPQLEAYELLCLEQGFEGVCIRSPSGFYKSGRSTLNEQYLLKIKRFSESEAEVIDFVELNRNENIPTLSELGLTKRSKAQAGLSPGGILGALKVRDLRTGVEFELGTGFTTAQRADIWEHRDDKKGQVVTYKFQPHGMKDRPRCPVFKGFRYDV